MNANTTDRLDTMGLTTLIAARSAAMQNAEPENVAIVDEEIERHDPELALANAVVTIVTDADAEAYRRRKANRFDFDALMQALYDGEHLTSYCDPRTRKYMRAFVATLVESELLRRGKHGAILPPAWR